METVFALVLVWGSLYCFECGGSLSRGGGVVLGSGIVFLFFPLVFGSAPPCRGQNTCNIRPFLGRPLLSRPLMHVGWLVRATKKRGTSTKKTPKISKKWSPAASDTVKGLCINIRTFAYGTEEVGVYIIGIFLVDTFSR